MIQTQTYELHAPDLRVQGLFDDDARAWSLMNANKPQ